MCTGEVFGQAVDQDGKQDANAHRSWHTPPTTIIRHGFIHVKEASNEEQDGRNYS